MKEMSMNQCSHVRVGISLMEVLISIGVVSIGLLGVVSLVPVASQQAEQGARNDRRANVGRRSFREFRVREFDNAGTGTSPKWLANTTVTSTAGDGVVFTTTTPHDFLNRPFCIDPRYVAANSTAFNSLASGAYMPFGSDATVGTFPIQMPIVSVSASGQGLGVMTPAQAEEVFVFQDDLEFNDPASNGDSPQQQFLTSGGANAKRYARGQFSWFATIVPDGTGWATLSTVICFQRNSLQNTDALMRSGQFFGEIDPANDANMSIQNQSRFYSSGLGALDVRMEWSPLAVPTVRSKNWVLMGFDNDANLGNGNEFFAWYRITSAGDVLKVGNEFFQDMTLSGPEWPVTMMSSVIFVPEVVSVYTKQIKIKNN